MLKVLTVIYLATEWFEIIKQKDRQSSTIENPGYKNIVM